MTLEEALPEPANPVGMDGIEFIEYATSQPQAFGALLQKMGFAAGRAAPLARGHALPPGQHEPDRQRAPTPTRRAPGALGDRAAGARCRVRAISHSLDLGAWDMPTRAAAMELNIPGIHGVGDSLIYFVDRHQDFSIYDVDFVPLAATPTTPAGAGRAALVRRSADASTADRTRDWLDFYRHAVRLHGAARRASYFGVLPKGTLLESPCHKFYLQLIEPPPGAEDIHWDEGAGARRPGRARTSRPATQALAGARHRVRRSRRGAAEREGRAAPRSTWAA